jgi:hypothetical protein
MPTIRDATIIAIMAIALASALFGASGCSHQPLPVVSAPAVAEREDTVPDAPLSTLIIPLTVPLPLLYQLIQERLQIPGEADWRTVTREGQSPEIAIRYQAELSTPKITIDGRTVHITLPIRYFGSFRARARTPFGSIWLTKNTRWGNRERPGLIELTVSSELAIDADWQLHSHSSLTGVELTAPDVDKLCAGKLFKICVPVDEVKERVHRELEQQIRALAEPRLQELDAQVAARADLPTVARRVWRRLQAGSSANGDTLALAPERMSLGYPTVTTDAVIAELRVWGRPRWSSAAFPEAIPLPPPAETDKAVNDVHFTVMSRLMNLSQGFSNGLASLPENRDGFRISEVKLVGPAAGAQRFVLAIQVSDGDVSSTAYGETSLLLDGASVGLREVLLSDTSSPLLAAAGYTPADLVALLSQLRCPLAPLLEARLSGLRALLANSISPWPANPLQGVRATLEAAYATRGGVTFSATAH